MNTVVVIASGSSLTDYHTAHVFNSDKVNTVIAVSDVGLTKCPWADALVSYDSAWWDAHSEYRKFKGRKFVSKPYRDLEHFDLKKIGVNTFLNSGLFAMYIARDVYKADRIVLLGFDMHRRNGQHFFGEHQGNLKNTTESIFQVHIKQFDNFSGCRVVNCTPNSDLKRFPICDLYDII
jgi:hypothetical protein